MILVDGFWKNRGRLRGQTDALMSATAPVLALSKLADWLCATLIRSPGTFPSESHNKMNRQLLSMPCITVLYQDKRNDGPLVSRRNKKACFPSNTPVLSTRCALFFNLKCQECRNQFGGTGQVEAGRGGAGRGTWVGRVRAAQGVAVCFQL